MSLSRAAPGPRLGAGTLRVDAARAIAKLREYQLADPTGWVLEGIRAAVASRARRIELTGDANDVWLAWEGEPWPAELLPRLLDELVSPEPARDSQHLRLLARAINSALGLTPAHVDLYAIDAGGAAQRVRYTPGSLEALRELAAEAAAPPSPALAPGMLLHLRRPAGLQVLGYLVAGGPPELPVARDACRDLAVPIRIDGADPTAPARDVLRLPLGEGLTGHLAFLDPRSPRPPGAHAPLEIAEHGVVIARYPLEPQSAPRAPVPARLYVDAPRMPTNASRSEVRRDAHPIEPAERQLPRLFAALVAQLVAAFHDSAGEARERLRGVALGLVGSFLAGAAWSRRLDELPPLLAPLAELPLVRDAAGVWRPIRYLWLPHAVHLGVQPYPSELAPWLSDLPWMPPGDPARLLLGDGGWDAAAPRRLARHAWRALEARKRFLAHAPREAKVREPVAPRAVVPVEGDGISGELCLLRAGRNQVTVLLDDRPIEVLTIDGPVPFEAVVSSSRLTPDLDYRGVAHDEAYLAVLHAVRVALVRAIDATPDAHPTLLREGIRLAVELGVLGGSSLAARPAWVTRDGVVSLDELRAAPVIGVASSDADHLPAGRPIVMATEAEVSLLRACVPGQVVDYRMARPTDFVRLLGDGAVAFEEPGLRGAIAFADQGLLMIHHAGRLLAQVPYQAAIVPCRIAFDADAPIPTTRWDQAIDLAGVDQHDFSGWERALLADVADAVMRRALAIDHPRALRLWEVIDARRGPTDPLLGAERLDALRDAPVLRVLGRAERISARELVGLLKGPLPYVADAPAVEPSGWPAIVGPRLLARAFARLVNRVATDGDDELVHRVRATIRERRLAALRARPVDPAPEGGVPLDPEVALGTVQLAATDQMTLDLRIEGRRFQQVTLPGPALAADIELTVGDADDELTEIPRERIEAIAAAVKRAAGALILPRIAASPRDLAEHAPTRRLIVGALLSGEQLGVLRKVAAFTTVQGERISVRDAMLSRAVRVATWDSDWLGPADGEARHHLDAPVIRCWAGEAGDELVALLDRLAPTVVDVTLDVTRLQTERRMARGLIQPPRLTGAEPALTRTLRELGEAGGQLGIGEIALVDAARSLLRIHAGGELRGEVVLDVAPSIALAVEAPELAASLSATGSLGNLETQQVTQRAQRVTAALIGEVLRTGVELPDWLRHRLRFALLDQRAEVGEVGDAPILEISTGRWVGWSALADQMQRFGDVWVVEPTCDLAPVDERRIAVRMSSAEAMKASGLPGVNLVTADRILRDEASARARRDRPRATSLALTAEERAGALAVVTLDGDGVTAPRGVVAVLDPRHANLRGLRLHRELHAFDPAADPCDWPTVAVVDDARISADRTWANPNDDRALAAVLARIREASDQATLQLGAPPAGVAEHRPIASAIGASRIRGRIWLLEPEAPGLVRARDRFDERSVGVSAPIGGWLAIHDPGADRTTDARVNTECATLYALLIRDLAARPDLDALTIAHVARAITRGTVKRNGVHADVLARIDATQALAPPPAPPLVSPPPLVVELPPPPAPPPPPHPLQALANSLSVRLSNLGVGCAVAIAEGAREPLIALDGGDILRLAGGSRVLAAIDPERADLVDLLAAHATTVLNVELTRVNDVHELQVIAWLLAG